MTTLTIAPGVPCDICWKQQKPGSDEPVLRLHMPQGGATLYLHQSCFDEGAAIARRSPVQ